MPDDRRRRSASRGKKKSKRQPSSVSRSRSRSPAKRRSSKEEKSSGRAPAKNRSPEKPRRQERPPQKAVAAAARHSDDDDSEEEASEQEEVDNSNSVSLEERVALLEVDNAALKAENVELKKKLIEFVRAGAASKVRAPIKKTSKPGQAEPPVPASPEPPKRSSEGGGAPDRRARLAAAAADAPSERATQRRRVVEDAPPPASARGGDGDARGGPKRGDDDGGDEDVPDNSKNAVMLVNGAMEAYNLSVPNNIPPEKRLPMVNEKMEHFMGQFGEKVSIIDLKSGGAVIKDRKIFGMRYGCVFRESGAKLKGTTHKRFYYDASGGRPTYCLDFETHASLVTATPGTPPDGKLGVRDPRTEHLAVLYEEKGSKITRMWLRPDTEKLGLDPTMGEEILKRTDIFKAFEEKIKEVKGGDAGEFYFFNYHETPTVG